jgi:hypothetical protein
MKSIVVFRSEAFDHSRPKDGSDPNAIPLGRDLADYLKTKLAERSIPVRNPIQGTDGWVVDGDLQNIPFSLFVHWAPIGTPPSDHWVIQPQVRRGFLKTLFEPRKPSVELEPVISNLASLLSEDTRISDLTWMDEAEFASVY